MKPNLILFSPISMLCVVDLDIRKCTETRSYDVRVAPLLLLNRRKKIYVSYRRKYWFCLSGIRRSVQRGESLTREIVEMFQWIFVFTSKTRNFLKKEDVQDFWVLIYSSGRMFLGIDVIGKGHWKYLTFAFQGVSKVQLQ